MFQSHELVYTHNPKTGQYIGGGYTLNSELLTGGAPPLISLSGGRKNRRKRSDSSESDDDNSNSNPNISSILSGNSSSIVIPAGLFLIHGTNRNNDDANDTASAFDLRPFLYNSDNDDNINSGSSSDDDSETDGDARKKKVRHNNVISDDIYTALFKMLSPNESDKKRYWVGSAVTCKRRRQQQKPHPTPAITRKQKKK